MAEYERSRVVQAAPDEVFVVVADVRNLPTYLPTVHAADQPDAGLVHVHGAASGGEYDGDGWLRVDEARRRLEWGTDEADCRGWLSVSPDGAGSEAIVHLSFAPRFDSSGAPIVGERREPDPIEAGLEAALDSIRNLVEGRGGKEQPAIATTT